MGVPYWKRRKYYYKNISRSITSIIYSKGQNKSFQNTFYAHHASKDLNSH